MTQTTNRLCSNVLRQPRATRKLPVFVRQPFTESGNTEMQVVQGVLDVMASLPVQVVTGLEAQSQNTFRDAFQKTTGLEFTPSNFRRKRLQMLDSSDAMVFIRTSLSESGAFEAAYNVSGGPAVPMFFGVWKGAPIKTTVLRDLDEFGVAQYVTFEHPDGLRSHLCDFFSRVRSVQQRSRETRPLPRRARSRFIKTSAKSSASNR